MQQTAAQVIEAKSANSCWRRIVTYHSRTKLEDTSMRLRHAGLITLLIALISAPALVTAEDNLGSYAERIAVEDVMARYVWTVDSLDADGYVAVFTEDA